MSKIYAVKCGRLPGVYSNWQDCKLQVDKFPGAVYKSFTNIEDANLFIGTYKTQLTNVTKQNVDFADCVNSIDIYTDGSHQRASNYLGIGAWCKYDNQEFSMSKECDSNLLSKYEIYDAVSNPTAEFLAFAEVLKIFTNVNLKSNIVITFYCDYVGMENWMTGRWEAKKPYIQKIKNMCLQYIDNINCKVQIKHVKGHSNNFGNDKADVLAGNNIHHNNFDKLVTLLSE